MTVSFVGLDLAKTAFQVHAVDDRGKPTLSKRLHRHALLNFLANVPRCIVGMEACATAHYWAREITRLGHVVRLMPSKYVKPCVKRHKNDQIEWQQFARLCSGRRCASYQSKQNSSRVCSSSIAFEKPWFTKRHN
jgi:transposase